MLVVVVTTVVKVLDVIRMVIPTTVVAKATLRAILIIVIKLRATYSYYY